MSLMSQQHSGAGAIVPILHLWKLKPRAMESPAQESDVSVALAPHAGHGDALFVAGLPKSLVLFPFH